MKTRLLLSTVFALSLFSLAPSALAQTGGATGSWGTANVQSPTCSDKTASNYSPSAPAGPTAANFGNPNYGCTYDAITPAPTGGTQPSGGGGINPTQPSGGGVTGVTLINPLKSGTTVQAFLNSILDFVITIGAIIVMLMLVYVGFLFVTAQGNDTKLTTAKQALLWTIIGALILLGAKAISAGLQATVTALSAGQ